MTASSSGVQHEFYPALEGLRAFTAFCVVLFHLGRWFGVPAVAANSGVAVDLFFCLSGYVLAMSYGKRLDQGLTFGGFVGARLIRLMPVLTLATLISVLYVVARSRAEGSDLPSMAIALALGLGLLNLPYLNAPQSIGGPQVFPLNGPQYSLFLEIVVNLLWAGLKHRGRLSVTLSLAALSLGLVVCLGLGGDQSATFLHGLPRVGASFFIGVALYQLGPRLTARINPNRMFTLTALMMVALFFYPIPAPFAVELLWIVLISPMLIISGASVRMQPGPLRSAALLAGAIAYPVYALHYPVFCWVNGLYQAVFGLPDLAIEPPIIVLTVVVFSYLALRFIDKPIRRKLPGWLGMAAPGATFPR
jgi:peptidoglycan/LPS O-acetylase OafA/YrhL